MKKILKEFKEFITRGNVIDLAVGMIIGAAFTAIVTALVNNIFKPLINMIPLGDLNGLITMLVARDANGVQVAMDSGAIDLTKSTYIDWGAFIMAVINFLLTAIILFIIIKMINTLRNGGKKLRGEKIPKPLYKELKEKGMTYAQMQEYVKKQREKEAAIAAAEAEKNKPETTESILAEIRELLKAQAKASTDGGQTEE